MSSFKEDVTNVLNHEILLHELRHNDLYYLNDIQLFHNIPEIECKNYRYNK